MTQDHFCLPGEPRILVAGGFSGHGFKFAPVIGELTAAALLQQGPVPGLAAFARARHMQRFAGRVWAVGLAHVDGALGVFRFFIASISDSTGRWRSPIHPSAATCLATSSIETPRLSAAHHCPTCVTMPTSALA